MQTGITGKTTENLINGMLKKNSYNSIESVKGEERTKNREDRKQ